MCNFNAICCHQKRYWCGALGSTRNTDSDKSDAQQLNEAQIVNQSNLIKINSVSNETISESNSSLTNLETSLTPSVDANCRCTNNSTLRSSNASSCVGFTTSTTSSLHGSKAASKATTTSSSHVSKAHIGSSFAALSTEAAVVESIKSSTNGSSSMPPLRSTLNKVPIVENTKRSANGSKLTSRIGSATSTRDQSKTSTVRISDEPTTNQRPINPAIAQEDNIILVERLVNQDFSKYWSKESTLNCYCQKLIDQQKVTQNEYPIFRTEIKPKQRMQRSFSYLRSNKPKQEPSKIEKEVSIVKSKTKSKRKFKRKAALTQATPETPETEEGKDFWFDCNIPLRVSIPTAICLGTPWDMLSNIQNSSPNNNTKLKALPAPGNKALVKADRNKPPLNTLGITPNTTHQLCITVHPMGYWSNVPSAFQEIEEPPPVEPSPVETKLPNKNKKQHLKRKVTKNNTSHKEDRDKSKRNRKSFDKETMDFTTRKGPEKLFLTEDETIYKCTTCCLCNRIMNQEECIEIRESINDRSSFGQGPENSSINKDMTNNITGGYTSRKVSKNYSISGDMANPKNSLIKNFMDDGENKESRKRYDEVTIRKCCNCSRIIDREHSQPQSEIVHRRFSEDSLSSYKSTKRSNSRQSLVVPRNTSKESLISQRSKAISNKRNSSLPNSNPRDPSKESGCRSDESVEKHKSNRVSKAVNQNRKSGGRGKSEVDWNTLAQSIKKFSDQLTETSKQLADNATYVRANEKDKITNGHQNNRTNTHPETEIKECLGQPVTSEKLQDLIAALPLSRQKRLIELLQQENNDQLKIKSRRNCQESSDKVEYSKHPYLSRNNTQSFLLLSSPSLPTQSHHKVSHISSLKPNKEQLEDDHILENSDDRKLTENQEKVCDQDSFPKLDRCKASLNVPLSQIEENENNSLKRGRQGRKNQHYNDHKDKTSDDKSKVKDLKICLLKQESHDSPPVLEEYNVAAFTRIPSSHPSQNSFKESQVNCVKSKIGEMENLHTINEKNVEIVLSDLKEFCQKSSVKYDDMLEKHIVLVPNRSNSEHTNAKFVGLCKPDEWKELKIPRTLTSRSRRNSPQLSVSRKYRKGPNIPTSSSQGKSKESRDRNCFNVDSKLFDYLRKNGISNGSQSPKSQYSLNETRSHNSHSTEISAKNNNPNAESQIHLNCSQFSKSCLSLAIEIDSRIRMQSEILESKHSPKDKPQTISRVNSMINHYKTLKSKPSQMDAKVSHKSSKPKIKLKKTQPHSRIQSKKPENSYRPKAKPQTSYKEKQSHNRNESEEAKKPKSEAKCHESQKSADICQYSKTETDNDAIVMHFNPRSFCCSSKDLRCQEEVCKNYSSHEDTITSLGVLIEQDQIRDCVENCNCSNFKSQDQMRHCVENCTCSTFRSQDLQRHQQMQLQQKLQQANYEYEKRQQQQLQNCESAHYGKRRREEAECICCSGYSHEQMQQRIQQKQRRQEKQQHLQQQQQHIQQQQYQQQQHFIKNKQQQQGHIQKERIQEHQQQEHVKQEQLQQNQQRQQQHIQQTHHLQQQQYNQQLQHQQTQQQQIFSNNYAQNQEQKENYCYCRNLRNHQPQQQQHVQLDDTQTSLSFSQQHMPQLQHLKLQDEKNCSAKYCQNPQQQQQSQMLKFPEENLENNCLSADCQQSFPCDCCNVAAEPDLSSIRSSFYQRTLHKYGILFIPEDHLQKMQAEYIGCVPCPCCSYAYSRQQQQHYQ